ncbi:MAG: hypothetical protein AAF502_24855 [Bacteroidota bacterium]
MKNLMIIFVCLLTSFQLIGCNNSDGAAMEVVNEFIEAMYKPVDFKKISDLYQNFPFSAVPKVDGHEINSIEKENGAVIAIVQTYWTKSDGTKIENNFRLSLEMVEDTWKIINSMGLSRANTAEPSAYDFGLKQGLIENPDDMWDIELYNAIKKAKAEMKKH